MGAGFHLGEATAAERTARDRLTFEAWGSRLSRQQYLDRERTLRQTVHGAQDMHSWVLRLPNGVVAASCETFRLPLLPTGAAEVVASVYVDPPLRGAKMASRLLEQLVAARREAGIDALVLFSEIGLPFYERLGFRRLPAPGRTFVAPWPALPRSVERLTRADLSEALARRRLLREGRIDLHLTEPIVDWHLERSRFYAEVLERPAPEVIGAQDGELLALWAPDFKCDVLRLLEVTGPAGASLEGVVAAAGREADRLGLSQVDLWDDPLSAQLLGGDSDEREDDLPMGLSFTPRGELILGPLSRAFWA